MTDIDNDNELTPEEEALAQRLIGLKHRFLTADDEAEKWTILGELVETGCFKFHLTKSGTEDRPAEGEILRIRLVD